MIFYSIVLFLAFFIFARFTRVMQLDGLNKWNMPLAFTLKALVGMYFLFIYTEFYGDGTLSADAGDFMKESKVLNEVFFKSSIDYFKFLTGIGDTHQLQMMYLADTHHWDAGAQSLINDNKNILRIHSLIHFISFNNPLIHVLVMSLLVLIGVKNFIIGLADRIKLNKNLQFWILVLIPSVLFWTSGLLKEPMLFLGIGIFIRGLFAKESKWKKAIHIILGVLLLIGFKPYVLVSILPALLFFLFYRVLPKFKIIGAILLVLLISGSSLILFSAKRDQVVHLITRKQQDFKNIGKGGIYAWNGDGFYYFTPQQFDDVIIDEQTRTVSAKENMKVVVVDVGGFESPFPYVLKKNGESYPIYFMRDESNGYIEIPQINDSFSQLLLNIPTAIQNALLRPFPIDPGSWLKYPAAVEVWLVFIFLLFAIWKRRKLESSEWAIIVSLTIFILMLTTIIGLTTPVLGAIVRYRIPAYIALVLIGMLIIDPQKKLKS